MEVFDVGRTLLSFADIREQALSLQFKVYTLIIPSSIYKFDKLNAHF